MAIKPEIASLPESVQNCVRLIIAKSRPQKLILFGSRAVETSRPNSDFDFAVKNKQCNDLEWAKLILELEAEPLSLFKIDLVEFEKLTSEYQEHIFAKGILIYDQN